MDVGRYGSGYGETLRKKREMGATDGNLVASSLSIDASKALVTLQAIWCNRGPLPLELCNAHTSVQVYQIDSRASVGRLQLGRSPDAHLLVTARPSWDTYVMEPGTDSVMLEHFVIFIVSLYGFRWIICLAPGSIPGRHVDRHLVCTRELIWSQRGVAQGSCVADADSVMQNSSAALKEVNGGELNRGVG